ncbi:MAG: hypothetical protein ACTJHL_09515 [Neisseriaceae bacterium]|nr:hypothetical protein [Neisseriaceae bacterium]
MNQKITSLGVIMAWPLLVFMAMCWYNVWFVQRDFFNSWSFAALVLFFVYLELAIVLVWLCCIGYRQQRFLKSAIGLSILFVLLSAVLLPAWFTGLLTVALGLTWWVTHRNLNANA